MTKEMQVVIDFCLKHSESASLPERISLYRGLAEFCSDDKHAAEFSGMADDLLDVEKRFQQLRLNLAFRNGGAK